MAADAGQRIGSVYAMDEDLGTGGHVRYSLLGSVDYVRMDEATGVLVLSDRAPHNSTTVDVVVLAASGPTQFTRATVHLEVRHSSSGIFLSLLLDYRGSTDGIS